MDINNLTTQTSGIIFSKEFSFCEQMMNIATSNIAGIEECIKSVMEYVPTEDIKKSFLNTIKGSISDMLNEVEENG